MHEKKLQFHWGIQGHDKALELLESDFTNAKLSHAYLFHGPEHAGKFSVARAFAGILQCEHGWCRTCSVCTEIERGIHSDTLEIQENGESLKIEEMKELISRVFITHQSRHKVVIIQNIERMGLEAANTLLKTLEEPPEGVVFLLTTSNLQEILETIVSRVRMIGFERVREEEIYDLVLSKYPLMDDHVLRLAAKLSLGRPGKALMSLENQEFFQEFKQMYDQLEVLFKKPDYPQRFAFIDDLIQRAKDSDQYLIREFLDMFLIVLRENLFLAQEQGDRSEQLKIVGIMKKTLECYDLLKRNVNQKLLLENLFLGF